jgi:hypothetical protein
MVAPGKPLACAAGALHTFRDAVVRKRANSLRPALFSCPQHLQPAAPPLAPNPQAMATPHAKEPHSTAQLSATLLCPLHRLSQAMAARRAKACPKAVVGPQRTTTTRWLTCPRRGPLWPSRSARSTRQPYGGPSTCGWPRLQMHRSERERIEPEPVRPDHTCPACPASLYGRASACMPKTCAASGRPCVLRAPEDRSHRRAVVSDEAVTR